jgi:hypothetical protein
MQIPLPELPANLASQAKAAKLEIRPSAKWQPQLQILLDMAVTTPTYWASNGSRLTA